MLTLFFALAAAVASADQTFVRGTVAGDATAVAAVLDQDFTWTDVNGRTLDAARVKQALPQPAIANEANAQIASYEYGSVAVVQANAGKLHTLRVWVKRPAGWRLLVYQEVKSLDASAPASAAPPAQSVCENPCGAVPYAPKTAVERGQADEAAVSETVRVRRCGRDDVAASGRQRSAPADHARLGEA
ncbi:MAG: hypothetical protein DMF87_17715 [Acidobacteria bacterium]|nr:MAG: hypothetical protein DMF87_17715 [Acidobacteriota bacterium]